jgi:prepilin-type N-terminal cleavage/methylation domain-containing protein
MARAEKGFSLLELVIAMAIFLLVSGMSFSLFNQQQASAKLLQGQTGLNVALRNAATLLQVDLAGAGSGYFQGVNMPSWPVGVTIVNTMSTSGATCYNSATTSYGYTCFDQINVIVAATPSTYPPIHATDSTGASGSTNCSYTNTGTAYGQAAVVSGTTWTLANTAAEFKAGDQLLLLNSTGTKITTVKLSAAPTVSGSTVKFTFSATNADGSTTSLANDPLDIAYCDGTANCATNNKLTDMFCASDWILKLAPINYFVCAGPGGNNTSICDQTSNSPDIHDPKLMRMQNGVASVVMEQIIGFRAGAALWNGASESGDDDSVSTAYNYLASTYCIGGTGSACTGGLSSPYNFSLIRAVRVSLIGRTVPSTTDNGFENAFDQGHYQVQGVAVVVNPRNMSMNDN